MLKFIPVFEARAGMAASACLDHYAKNHGRLAASNVEFNRHVPRYIQNYAIGTDTELAGKALGASEVWFYSLAGFWESFQEPRMAEFRADEERFVNLERLLLVAAQPAHIFGPFSGASFKMMRFLRRREGVSAEEANRFWEIEYARAASGDKRLRRAVDSYVQNRPAPGFTHDFPTSRSCDIAEEYWIRHPHCHDEALAAETELRERTGYAAYFDVGAEVAFLAASKTVWELGEDPARGLSRLG